MAQISHGPPAMLRALLDEGKVLTCTGGLISREVLTHEGAPAFPTWHDALLRAAAFASAERGVAIHSTVELILSHKPCDYQAAADQVWSSLTQNERTRFFQHLYGLPYSDVRRASLASASAVWSLGSKLVVSLTHDPALRWASPQPNDVQVWPIDGGPEYGLAIKGELVRPCIWPLNGHIGHVTDIVPPVGSETRLHRGHEHYKRHHHGIEAFAALAQYKSFLFVGFGTEDYFLKREIEWLKDVLLKWKCATSHYMLLETRHLEDALAILKDVPSFTCFDHPAVEAGLDRRLRALCKRSTVFPLTSGDFFEIQLGDSQPVIVGRSNGRVSVGRDPTCDVWINDPTISSHHADLHFKGEILELVDRKSRNGTFLNNQRVQPDVVHTLTLQDMIKIHSAPLVIRPAAHPPTPPTTQPARRFSMREAQAEVTMAVPTLTTETASTADDRLTPDSLSTPPPLPQVVQVIQSTPPPQRNSSGMPLAVIAIATVVLAGASMTFLAMWSKAKQSQHAAEDPVAVDTRAFAKQPQVGEPDETSLCDFSAPSMEPPPPDADSMPTGKVCGRDVALKDVIVELGGKSARADMVLIALSGGAYTMGSDPGETGRNNDEHPRPVALSRFEICETEITVGQYLAVTGHLPDLRQTTGSKPIFEFEHPVQQISWTRARLFMNELTRYESKRLGISLTECYDQENEMTIVAHCTGFRLPTEAEWEYAARALQAGPYGFEEAENYCSYAHTKECEQSPIVPWREVAVMKPNGFGVRGMHGNLMEWVYDSYTADRPTNPATDPVFDNPRGRRVLRGGSYARDRSNARSANRWKALPDEDRREYGMRCARGPHFPSSLTLTSMD